MLIVIACTDLFLNRPFLTWCDFSDVAIIFLDKGESVGMSCMFKGLKLCHRSAE